MAREKCPVCGGSGKELHYGGMENYYETCHKCNGTGYVGEDDVYRDRSSDSSSSSSYTPSRSGGSSASGFDYGDDIEALNKTCDYILRQLRLKGKYDEAIAMYDKLISSWRGDPDVAKAVKNLREDTVERKAKAEADANRGTSSSASANDEAPSPMPSGLSPKLQALYKAAENGDANAQNELADAYFHNEIPNGTTKEAMYWCTKAAENGHADAQCNLGCYYQGKDKAKAIYWFEKAAAQGDEYSKECLAELEAEEEEE